MKKIVQQDDPVLRKIAEPIAILDITKESTQTIIKQMFESLAAPQIGYSKRIFVVSAHVLEANPSVPLIYINPEIIKHSKDKKNMEEGCLSCRWWYGKTKRASHVVVKAFDEHGKGFTQEARGLLAQIFQHEIDHLNGILFIDHAKNLTETSAE